MEAPNEENQRVWDALLPIGRGFVNVSSPETYGLLAGVSTESGVDRYAVSMYHQLHCLALLRDHYWTLIDLLAEPGKTDADRQEAKSHILKSRHEQHCFAYLAEGIQCSADLTIEWAMSDGKMVDGWGVPHQCKDPEAVRAWMLANHGPLVEGRRHLHE
ncbi:Protein of unknown function DUF3328 [Apiospora rasikravindrae]|uniref:Uncharacterized protein n=1 Tax=Apiospora rasikravindrae TaxID=990691 RepID=A0ABR1T0A8_9PEZI